MVCTKCFSAACAKKTTPAATTRCIVCKQRPVSGPVVQPLNLSDWVAYSPGDVFQAYQVLEDNFGVVAVLTRNALSLVSQMSALDVQPQRRRRQNTLLFVSKSCLPSADALRRHRQTVTARHVNPPPPPPPPKTEEDALADALQTSLTLSPPPHHPCTTSPPCQVTVDWATSAAAVGRWITRCFNAPASVDATSLCITSLDCGYATLLRPGIFHSGVVRVAAVSQVAADVEAALKQLWAPLSLPDAFPLTVLELTMVVESQ